MKSVFKQKKHFNTLAPIDIIENDAVFSAIDFALNDKSVFNIAVTGAYGSGKSSVLRSYEKKRTSYKYLNISLASFFSTTIVEPILQETSLDDIDDTSVNNGCQKGSISNKEEHLNKIEYSILQQILYQVSSTKLPHSHFKRIKNHSKLKNLAWTIYTVLFSLSFLFLANQYFRIFVNQYFNLESINLFSIRIFNTDIANLKYLYHDINLHVIINVLILIFGILVLIKNIIKTIENVHISKLSFNNVDFTINSKGGTSLLNKHLDELLYFFERNHYDVLVIEDLDRCQSHEIFIKLRELNRLLNNYEKISKLIKFVFVLRDDIFTNKDRTKFFEFIIPIIPVVSNTNSANKLLKIKNDSGEIFNDVTKTFIKQVCRYIDDMRILKNSVNEYIIYAEQMKEQKELAGNNLLAIIIYKNLYPKGFHDLSNSKGVIYNIFSMRDDIVKEVISCYEKDILACKKQIDNINRENLKDLKELRALYVSKLNEMCSQNSMYIPSYQTYINDNEKFNEIMNREISPFQFMNQNRGRQPVLNYTFDTIEKQVDRNQTYVDRERTVQDKVNTSIDEIKLKINKCQKSIKVIRLLSFYELITQYKEVVNTKMNDMTNELEKENNENIKGNIDISEKEFVLFLIRNNFINEKYTDYITYFYEGLLTHDDLKFVQSISNQKPLPCDYKLGNPEHVITEILEHEWKQIEVLNNSLFITMLCVSNKDSLRNYIALIINQKDQSFFYQFECPEKSISKYLNLLWSCWDRMMEVLVTCQELTSERKDTYIVNILKHVEFDANKANKKILITHINALKNFDIFQSLTDMKIVEDKLIELGVKIDNLDSFQSFTDTIHMFDLIINKSLYKINLKMCTLIISYVNKKEYSEDAVYDFYTRFNESEPLNDFFRGNHNLKYINDNIIEFVENVVTLDNRKVKESEKYFIKLLHHDIITENEELKARLCELNQTVISDINKIYDKALWHYFFTNNTIEANWSNVLIYFIYLDYQLSEDLIAYLNNQRIVNKIITTILPRDEDDSTVSIFYNTIFKNNIITNDTYQKLVKIYPSSFPDLDFDNIDKEKVLILIKNKKIDLTAESYEALKKLNDECHIELLFQYKDDYFEDLPEISIDSDDLEVLLVSHVLSKEEKVKLIEQNIDDFFSGENISTEFIVKTLIDLGYTTLIEFEYLLKLFENINDVEIKIDLLLLQLFHLDES
ncbi:MAG: hypothetical protein PF487_06220, partial [Bacteroidales bacterium]|nr:hypothetical protein [Bacteroidales bacterium]